MNKLIHNNEENFQTDHTYAIVSGWLIVPAISTFLTLLGALILIIFVNPFHLHGVDLSIYLQDLFSFIYIIILYFFWIKRSRTFPKLIILYFLFHALWELSFYYYNVEINFLNVGMSFVLIVYFIRSERVKQTFIN